MKVRLLTLFSLVAIEALLALDGLQSSAAQPIGDTRLPLERGDSLQRTDGKAIANGITTRVSVASDGTQGNYKSSYPSISADGRYVAFESDASNLVSDDTNGKDDVFVHDRQTGQTERISVASDGSQGNDISNHPSISADGRYVAFHSWASNLVAGDTNSTYDVFVHDRQTGQTERISVSSAGTQGNGSSWVPSISAGGRYVAFGSDASNLVAGDTNGQEDVFVHDRQTGQTERVSVASDGSQADFISDYPSISADGRYVAFDSWATTLVGGDTNWRGDVFVHDRQTGQTERVSVASDGSQGNDVSLRSSISADGRYVAFDSGATNLVSGDTNDARDVFTYDRVGAGGSIVSEARLDIGMPYSANRGCPSPYTGCGGPYHGFYNGVCTDLAMDAYNAGVPFNIQNALDDDHRAHPGRYRYGTARNAEDMRRYFSHNQQLLSHSQPYRAGDIAFFDWRGDGLSNHVNIISEVDASGRPLRMVDATGIYYGNPSGRAFEHSWSSYYDQHVQAHGRLGGGPATLLPCSATAETLQILRVAVDSPSAMLRLQDANGRSTSDAYDENLVASNVESFIPYIPGGAYADMGTGKVISVTQPLSNTTQYLVEITGGASAQYHLSVQTIQDGGITASAYFTESVALGETQGITLQLGAPGGVISFAASTPAPMPEISITPYEIEMTGLPGTLVQTAVDVAETGGQQALSGVSASTSDVMNQNGQAVTATLFAVMPTSFDVPAGGSQSVQLEIDLAGVQPGVYQGNLLITSTNGGTQLVPLSLAVRPFSVFLPITFKNAP